MSGAYDFPIKGFIETSFIDWKHQLSSVIFCGGCNFRCPFCHTADLVLRHGALVEVPLSYIDDTLHRFRAWTERVVITGGEPTIHESLFWMIERLKERRFMVKLDTNGSNPRVVRRLVREGQPSPSGGCEQECAATAAALRTSRQSFVLSAVPCSAF